MRLLNAFVLLSLFSLTACGGGGGDDDSAPPASVSSEYVVFAWNDLGMHCLNPTYDTAVILPPYNNVMAQVIKRGNPPQVITSGITVEYRIVDNTYSYGKESFGQFWDNDVLLFGVDLPLNTGLNLEDPSLHNGLAGSMALNGDHFQVNGIPVTPVYDNGSRDPYQVAEITVKNNSGSVLAVTRATVPTSDEISCAKCHNSTANVFLDILQTHDARVTSTNLVNQRPVLCAQCHGSPALGTTGPGTSGKYLSQAIHGSHASRGASCYDCHPGNTAKCNRSTAHTAADGNCIACHGTMADVANSISSGSRTPWLAEPECSQCHAGIAEVSTAPTLYRNARGHGSVYCSACHGSPHAMVPSQQAKDNYQALQYQGKALSMGSCAVCHDGSKGEGSGEFLEKHGPGKRSTACNVCHTAVTTADTSKWPHDFQWKNR